MKRTCLELNTDEQNICEFHLDDNSFNERPFDQKDIQHVKISVKMKNRIYTLIVCMALLSCETQSPSIPSILKENSRQLPEITKILFIGNSHTNRNDIPGTIQMMAASAGDSTYSHNETQPGYTLANHSVREATLKTIDSLEWDFVILQEQGGTQAIPNFMIDTAVYKYADILIDAIKRNNSHTKIILYMTHAYEEGVLSFNDTTWAKNEPLVSTYRGMQDRIRENNIAMAEWFNVEVSPAGVMWKIFADSYPEVNLFNSDEIHPLPNGSYLLACAIYSSIYTKSPVGKFIPANVNKEEGVAMQNLVYQSLFKGKPDWKTY